MREVPSESVDVVFADPPYFGNQSGLSISRYDGSENFSTSKAAWAKRKKLRVQIDFHRSWLSEAKRVLKPSGTVWACGTYHSIGAINLVMQDMGFKLLNEIVLVKSNAPPNFKGTSFRAITESMLWAKRSAAGTKKFNYWKLKEANGGKQMNNVWEFSATKNPFRHLAVKHPLVLERVIAASSDRGDLILDPFCGSGTTGYVARAMGRKCALFEVDASSCELAEKRVRGEFGSYQPTADY